MTSSSPHPVYVVDDDSSVRESVASLIRSAGWSVETFGSARQFLESDWASRPSCVVLDLDLPGMSGLELQRKLDTRFSVIFLTGRGDIPTSVRAMKAGAREFLTKPPPPDELLEAIGRALANPLPDDVIGKSRALRGVLDLVEAVAPTEARLIESHLDALADKNQELEAFAGRAAHDLRSPMSPIRGYADLIVESKGSPEQVEMMARRIQKAVERMGGVVDDMLALSVSGRPAPGVSSSSQVATEVLEELGSELADVAITTKLAGGSVACAAGVLGQILRSLVHNAVKYRDRKRPLELAIETRDVESMVEILVRDNGVGMDSETATHAFENHFRGKTHRELPGYGLGLAIVERATRALGGTCELSSVLDQGTRISVRLPHA
jgi:signal transduction histidine kinase